MDNIDASVLHTLAYFEQFNRALTLDDIYVYLWGARANRDTIKDGIYKSKYIFKKNNYFALSQDSIELTLKRQELIIERRKSALQIADLIRQYPGVASILLMNSLAMQTVKKTSDLDFLIICKKNSLYSTRLAILAELKRKGLAKSKGAQAGLACLGYWLTEDKLDVWKYQTDELTAAYWIATMVPLYGINGYRKFIEANKWIYRLLPNWRRHEVAHIPSKNNDSYHTGNIIEYIAYYFSRTKILLDPEFRKSKELVCTKSILKLHSLDKRPEYGKKTQNIIDNIKVKHT